MEVPLGVVDEPEAKGVHNTGALNLGGSIAHSMLETAKNSGARKSMQCPRNPATFRRKDEKQYIIITATGKNVFNHVNADRLMLLPAFTSHPALNSSRLPK